MGTINAIKLVQIIQNIGPDRELVYSITEITEPNETIQATTVREGFTEQFLPSNILWGENMLCRPVIHVCPALLHFYILLCFFSLDLSTEHT